jgi:hypothetical protein
VSTRPEIKTWQIIDGKLTSVATDLKNEGRTEPYDFEPWLASNAEIIGPDIMLIGRQVSTKSGPIDLLGIDKSGNTVVIEIKRSELPREALAQAIDYASNVAGWTVDKLSEIYSTYANILTRPKLDFNKPGSKAAQRWNLTQRPNYWNPFSWGLVLALLPSTSTCAASRPGRVLA